MVVTADMGRLDRLNFVIVIFPGVWCEDFCKMLCEFICCFHVGTCPARVCFPEWWYGHCWSTEYFVAFYNERSSDVKFAV